MTPEQLKKFKRNSKQYLQEIAAIYPSTAPRNWSEAIDEVLNDMPFEVEDQAVWGSILLGWYIGEAAEEAALNETLETTNPKHRREIQKVASRSLMQVYRTAVMIPSLNLKKALPVALGYALMSYATNEATPIEGSQEVLKFLKRIENSIELKTSIQSALDETLISGAIDHFAYIFTKSVLWPSPLGYGLWQAIESPSEASDLYRSVNFSGMREFITKAFEGGE